MERQDADTRYGFGIACVLASSLFTSTSGILVRLIEQAGAWQILFHRSAAFVVVLLLFLAWRHGRGLGRAFLVIGRPGLVAALALTMAFTCFILALLQTSVANAVFIVGTSPIAAALLAWVVLREPVNRRAWVAIAVAVLGIGIMMGEGLAGGTVTGSLLALCSCLSYATALVAFRIGRDVDMLPAVCLAGVLSALIAGALAPGLALSGRDLGLSWALGVVQLGFQYILITMGSRHVRAAEIALLSRFSAVLAPLWVWIGVGEVPGPYTLLGGVLVLSAVVWQTAGALRGGAPQPGGS